MDPFTNTGRPTHHYSYSAGSSQSTLRDSGYYYAYTPNSESFGLLSMPPYDGAKDALAKPYPNSTPSIPDEIPKGRKRYLNPYYIYPISVLVVHTSLLAASWTFFAFTISKPVPLAPTMAVFAREHIQSVTLVVTLLASFIALLSTVLYTRAIRYALARFVAGSVSLYSVVAATQMANTSPIKDFRKPLWTIAAAILAFSVNAITAGWSTLIIPKDIEITSNMKGFELDLKSFAFKKLMDDNKSKVNADLFARVLPITEASGSTAVSTHFNLPSILNVNKFSIMNSTAGIMPIAIQPIDSNILSARGQSIPVNIDVERSDETPPGFPVRFSTIQQGFSAQIRCQQKDLDETTIPSLRLRSQADTLFGAPVTLAQLEVVCPTATNSSVSEPVLTSKAVDALFGISCPVTQVNGQQRWDLIMYGWGLYKPIKTTVCSIFPEVNTVHVDYSANTILFNSSFPSFINGSQPWGGEAAPWLGDFAMSVFLRGLKVGQTTAGNSMGDTVLTFLETLPNTADTLNQILEQYVRGVLELSITFLRTVYTQENNGLFPGGNSTIPQSMRTTTNGTYWASTIGWHQASETVAGVLLAPTVVSLASILIIIVTLFYSSSHPELEDTHHFDPGDILHIMSASSAGELKTVFPPFHENDVRKNIGDVMITLKPVDGPGSRPGFVNKRPRSSMYSSTTYSG